MRHSILHNLKWIYTVCLGLYVWIHSSRWSFLNTYSKYDNYCLVVTNKAMGIKVAFWWRWPLDRVDHCLAVTSKTSLFIVFSSPEPKAHGELWWSHTVRRRRRCRRRPDVRLSTIFKIHLLLIHWWEFDQISQEWSLVGPLSKLFKWFRSIAYLGHRS